MSEEEKSPIDRLFDEDDTSPISLFNEKGEEVKFEQIALIPVEEKIYAISKLQDFNYFLSKITCNFYFEL